MVYDNFLSALRAQDLAGRMAVELQPAFAISTKVWNFDLATHPDLRDRAAKDAIEADMIIISVSAGDDLSSGATSWMQNWLPQKRGGLAALVALLSEPSANSSGPPPVATSLRQMAETGGMEFLYHTANLREDCFKYALETMSRHGVGSRVATGGTP